MVRYKIKFSLFTRSNGQVGARPVRMRVSWAGNRFDQNLPVSVDPQYWDEELSIVKPSCRPNGDRTFAAKTNGLIADVREAVVKYFSYCDINNINPAIYGLKKWMGAGGSAVRLLPSKRLFSDVAKECLFDSEAARSWSLSTIAHFRNSIQNVEDFSPKLSLGDVNAQFLMGFVEYLFGLGNSNKTVKNKISHVKWVLSWADKHDYPVDASGLHYQQKLKGTNSSSSEVTYLTWDEMMRLKDYPFRHNRQLAQARDVFLFCCFSGLRYSDVYALKKSDISDGRIRIVAQKTSQAIYVELNAYTKEILDRYSDLPMKGKALPVTTLRGFNGNLKKLAQMAGIDAPTRKVAFVKNERIETVVPKYRIISSHCARRSFVINALRLGIPAEVIMSWTGHADRGSMRPYVKIVDELKGSEMSKFDRGVTDSAVESVAVPEVAASEVVKADRQSPWCEKIANMNGVSDVHKQQMITIMDEIAKGQILFQVDLAERLGLCLDTVHKRVKFLVTNGFVSYSGWGRAIRWEILCK